MNQKKNPHLFQKIEKELRSNSSIIALLNSYFIEANPKLVYLQIHINQADDKFVFKHSDSDNFDDEINFFHVDTNLNTIKTMI